MRHLIPLTVILIYISCKGFSPAEKAFHLPLNSTIRRVNLLDSLGYISIAIPNRYDTFFRWGFEPGCGLRVEIKKYRFQPKSYQLFRESGMMGPSAPEFIDQFTITHDIFRHYEEMTDSSIIYSYHERRRNDLLMTPAYQIIKSDSVEIINGNYFSVFIIDIQDSEKKLVLKKVVAATLVRRNVIDLEYELRANQVDSISNSFITNSIALLKTLVVGNGY